MRKGIYLDEDHHTMLVEITKHDKRGTYVNALQTLIKDRHNEIKRQSNVETDRDS
jgi:hypothetical protein